MSPLLAPLLTHMLQRVSFIWSPQAALQTGIATQAAALQPKQPAAWSVDGGLVLHEAAGTAVDSHTHDLIQVCDGVGWGGIGRHDSKHFNTHTWP